MAANNASKREDWGLISFACDTAAELLAISNELDREAWARAGLANTRATVATEANTLFADAIEPTPSPERIGVSAVTITHVFAFSISCSTSFGHADEALAARRVSAVGVPIGSVALHALTGA
jgi:hypothetical protein